MILFQELSKTFYSTVEVVKVYIVSGLELVFMQ